MWPIPNLEKRYIEPTRIWFVRHTMEAPKFWALAIISVAVPATIIFTRSGPSCTQAEEHSIQTTLLMPAHTYARQDNWDIIAASAASDPHVAEFVVTWLNPVDPPPKIEGARVVVRERSIAQRFNVSDIKTEFVTLVDDDIVLHHRFHQRLLLAASEGFGIVGADRRGYSKTGTYYYTCGYFGFPKCSIALTKTMVVRTRFLESFLQDDIAAEYVRTNQNCEDILMNFHVQRLTRQNTKFVSECTNGRTELNAAKGLSTTRPNWTSKRSQCVRWARKHYKIA